VATHRVYNANNVLVQVSDGELDDAAKGSGALSAELANAAGTARRLDLIDRLRATLASKDRITKLAAARALLALGDRASIGVLREHANAEDDAIVAGVFRGIAVRLEGVEALRKAFENGDQDPALAGALAVVYNGTFELTAGDLELLLDMVAAYLANTAKWIATMDRDEWKSDLETLVATLAEGAAHVPDRERARAVLTEVGTSRAGRDTKQAAKRLLAGL